MSSLPVRHCRCPGGASLAELPEQKLLLDQVEVALEEIHAGGNSKGILFTGPSGTGKTTALDLVAALRLPHVDGVQRRVPCCRIASSSHGDMAAIARSILQQLNVPESVTSRYKRDRLEREVVRAMTACGVQILIFEEFHNALRVGDKRLRDKLSNFLKNLWNVHRPDDPSSWALPVAERKDKRFVIIVSGTEHLRPVFDQDQELASRFSCRINLKPLWFDTAESRENFGRVFTAIVSRHGLHDVVNCSDPDILSRSLFACNSHLRRLDELLQRTASLRKRDPDAAVPELMEKAFDSVLRTGPAHSNPFSWSHDELTVRIATAMKTPRPA